jgi:dienelactone hydrolase
MPPRSRRPWSRLLWLTLAAAAATACDGGDDGPVTTDGDVAHDHGTAGDDAATAGDGSGAAANDDGSGATGVDATIEALRAQFSTDGPFEVETWSPTFEDTSRPTNPNGGFEGAASRELPATIWVPAVDTPVPLVIYGHGFMSQRTDNRVEMALLASHGFVVAAVDFPLTNRGAPGGANVVDIENQPGDVSFLIDQLVAASADSTSPVAGKVDAARVGIVGVSLGALTALITAFHPSYLDERIDAVVTAAPPACYAPVQLLSDRSVPLLIVHGDNDSIVPFEANAVPAYEAAIAPKALLTILNGNHTNFANAATLLDALPNADTVGCTAIASQIPLDQVGVLAERLGGRSAAEVDAECPLPCAGIDDAPPTLPVRQQTAAFTAALVAWLRHYLTDDASARTFLRDGLAVDGVSAIQADLGEEN